MKNAWLASLHHRPALRTARLSRLDSFRILAVCVGMLNETSIDQEKSLILDLRLFIYFEMQRCMLGLDRVMTYLSREHDLLHAVQR